MYQLHHTETNNMSENQFQGKWVTVKDSEKGFDELMDAMGLPAFKDSWKGIITTMDYKVEGDTWNVTVSNDKTPGEKVYTVKLGETFDTNSLEGFSVKVKLTLIGDNKTLEEHISTVDGKEHKNIIERTVNGDIMDVVTSGAGASMTYQMKRA